jgi:hypothetical protein
MSDGPQQHVGGFTVRDKDYPADSTMIAQPESHASAVRCSCGWVIELKSNSLQKGKALLAQHQHSELGIE